MRRVHAAAGCSRSKTIIQYAACSCVMWTRASTCSLVVSKTKRDLMHAWSRIACTQFSHGTRMWNMFVGVMWHGCGICARVKIHVSWAVLDIPCWTCWFHQMHLGLQRLVLIATNDGILFRDVGTPWNTHHQTQRFSPLKARMSCLKATSEISGLNKTEDWMRHTASGWLVDYNYNAICNHL